MFTTCQSPDIFQNVHAFCQVFPHHVDPVRLKPEMIGIVVGDPPRETPSRLSSPTGMLAGCRFVRSFFRDGHDDSATPSPSQNDPPRDVVREPRRYRCQFSRPMLLQDVHLRATVGSPSLDRSSRYEARTWFGFLLARPMLTNSPRISVPEEYGKGGVQ